MRFHARVVSLLLAALLLISVQNIQMASDRATDNESIPAPVLHGVRETLLAINLFLADGDPDALWQTLDRTGHALDPWPQVDTFSRDRIALAFRATFPELRLALTHIAPSDNGFLIRLEARDDTGSLPPWLAVNGSTALLDQSLLIAPDDRGVLRRIAGASPLGPIAERVPASEAAFPRNESVRLFAARVTLTPEAGATRYLAVHAPALVAPETGSLQINGEGRLLVLESGRRDWRELASGVTTLLRPGDLLYLPAGHAIATTMSSQPATFVFSGIVASEPSRATVDADGRIIPADLTQMAATEPGIKASTWFGAIEPLAMTISQPPAGTAVLAATWVVLPPGSQVGIDADLPIVAVEIFGSNGSESTVSGPLFANPTGRSLILMVVRLV